MFELDHIFFWSDVGAPEADRLVRAGLTEGDPNVHPGQGTANKRFFFHNAFLELVWVADSAEAQSGLVQPTQIWQRWCECKSGGSPFGVCLRPAVAGAPDLPFPSWEYRPPYLPDPLAIHVAMDIPLTEPWWGYLAFGRRPDHAAWQRRQPLQHRAGLREITHARFFIPRYDSSSSAAIAAARTGQISLTSGEQHLLELTFDHGATHMNHDFRPNLPLMFRW